MALRILITLFAAVLCCGCYDRFDEPQHEDAEHEANISIAALHDFWRGKAVTINENMIIGGRVTSSDRAGNFYRTFTILDATGGAEILAGPTNLFNSYPIGCYVNIYLKGCAIDEENGVLQVGLMAEEYDYAALSYLQSKVNLDKHITRDSTIQEAEIPVLYCNELNEDICGCPVTIKNLRCTATTDDSGKWSGYARFEDPFGNPVYTYTSDYANFASETIPGTEVALTGIVQFGTVPQAGRHFILKMRSREDCSTDN